MVTIVTVMMMMSDVEIEVRAQTIHQDSHHPAQHHQTGKSLSLAIEIKFPERHIDRLYFEICCSNDN